MKILLAIDDDASSYEAAVTTAEWFSDDASVTALHVGTVHIDDAIRSSAAGGTSYPIVPVARLRDQQRDVHRAARDLAHRAATVARGTPRADVGDPSERIVETARLMDADLIVVGTGDRSWLSRLVHSSVSTDVVKRAPCSVLVVRPTHAHDPDAGSSVPSKTSDPS